jgi:hypothetical protein
VKFRAGEPEERERCGDLNLERKMMLKWVLKNLKQESE